MNRQAEIARQRFDTEGADRLRELTKTIKDAKSERKELSLSLLALGWPKAWVAEAGGVTRPTIDAWMNR